jgi:TonB family protein
MPMLKFFFLTIILLSNMQLQARQIKDKENPSKKECDFAVFKPRRGSDLLNSNQVIERVPPEYPELARKAHIKGTVIVKILVDQSGNVIRACGLKGHPLLRSAAVAAALKWKYKEWSSLYSRKTFVESVIVFSFNADASTSEVERK